MLAKPSHSQVKVKGYGSTLWSFWGHGVNAGIIGYWIKNIQYTTVYLLVSITPVIPACKTYSSPSQDHHMPYTIMTSDFKSKIFWFMPGYIQFSCPTDLWTKKIITYIAHTLYKMLSRERVHTQYTFSFWKRRHSHFEKQSLLYIDFETLGKCYQVHKLLDCRYYLLRHSILIPRIVSQIHIC